MSKKVDTQTIYLINQPDYRAGEGRPKLLRISLAATYTKLDFGYQTTDYYIRGGWVRIAPETFLRMHDSDIKYKMIKTENIPLSPDHHHFNTSKDWLYYSLFFEPIPVKTCVLDVIEADPGEDTDFNYFDVNLDAKKMIALY